MPVILNWAVIERFMELREIGDLSALSDLTGVHFTILERMKEGKAMPTWANLAKLCLHLGVGPENLLSYRFSEDDLEQPKMVFGEHRMAKSKWLDFRQLDRKWRKLFNVWTIEEARIAYRHESTLLISRDRGALEAMGYDPARKILEDEGFLEIEPPNDLKSPANIRAAKAAAAGWDLLDFADVEALEVFRRGLENEQDLLILRAYQHPPGGDACGLQRYLVEIVQKIHDQVHRDQHADKCAEIDKLVGDYDENIGIIDRRITNIKREQYRARITADLMDSAALKMSERPVAVDPTVAPFREKTGLPPTYGEVDAGWIDFIELVRENKPALAQFLSNASLHYVEDVTITLLFGHDDLFARTQVFKSANKAFLNGFLQHYYQWPFKLRGLTPSELEESEGP